MKIRIITSVAVASAAAIMLSACATATQDKLADAVATRINYCGIKGSTTLTVGGVAGTGTSAAHNATFDCPPMPFPAAVGQVVAAPQ